MMLVVHAVLCALSVVLMCKTHLPYSSTIYYVNIWQNALPPNFDPISRLVATSSFLDFLQLDQEKVNARYSSSRELARHTISEKIEFEAQILKILV